MKKTKMRGISDRQLHGVLLDHKRMIEVQGEFLVWALRELGHPLFPKPAEGEVVEAEVTDETAEPITTFEVNPETGEVTEVI